MPGEATAERQSRTELVDAALTSLLTAAQRADFEALTLRQQMQRATDAYHEAEQRAIDAWNAYAAAIRKAVGDSLVVSQSRLGALFDDNGTGLAEET